MQKGMVYAVMLVEVKTRVDERRVRERSKSNVAWQYWRSRKYMGRGGQRTITLYLSHILYIYYFFWTCVPNYPSLTPPPQSIVSELALSYFSLRQ